MSIMTGRARKRRALLRGSKAAGRGRLPSACALAALLILSAASAHAQDAASFFRQNCVSCHTIGGGRLVGPDLKDVEQRKDRAWLRRFILDPKGVLDSGDPYAAKLLQEARGALMPKAPGINDALTGQLLDLIAAESKLPKSQFVGVQVSDRPFTTQDAQSGRAIFLGETRLLSGGAPCVSCHSVAGLAGLGGGRLGPDLTRVFERLGGRKGLGTWLGAPPTVTMAPVFKNHPLDAAEIFSLLAFFQDAAQRGGVADVSTWMFNFLLLGLGGTVLVLILFDLAWIKRFRTVRRSLVLGFGATKGGKR